LVVLNLFHTKRTHGVALGDDGGYRYENGNVIQHCRNSYPDSRGMSTESSDRIGSGQDLQDEQDFGE
jgi:hypothetical protein